MLLTDFYKELKISATRKLTLIFLATEKGYSTKKRPLLYRWIEGHEIYCQYNTYSVALGL